MRTILILLGLVCCWSFSALGQRTSNPDASPEAITLLNLFYSISGKYTLTGQHNYPNTKDRNTRFAFEYTGQTPVIWSSDFGFSATGDKDSFLARPDLIKEAIRQHQKGSIITLCWHAVPPTAEEPVTFQPLRDKPHNPDSLASVQGRLTEEQYKELMTPGTKLYNHWAKQVDAIAYWLKKLRDAHVPVLWRPYHEMNGDWFWWGGRVGKYSTADLYRQLYDRMVNVHKLNNLVWVWNVDRPSIPIRKFSNFYPGDKYLDIASLDVYGSDFNQAYYDSLVILAKGKPVLFGEVGNPPSISVFEHQPKWASWVIWAGMVRNTTKQQYAEMFSYPRLLTMEDPKYHEISVPFRKECSLPVLPFVTKYPVNFSGTWILNEELSDFGKSGPSAAPYLLKIDQDEDVIRADQYLCEEWTSDRITTEEILLDGTETKTMVYNVPAITKAFYDDTRKTIVITSFVKRNNGELKNTEEWSLDQGGKILQIRKRIGENSLTLSYSKK